MSPKTNSRFSNKATPNKDEADYPEKKLGKRAKQRMKKMEEDKKRGIIS